MTRGLSQVVVPQNLGRLQRRGSPRFATSGDQGGYLFLCSVARSVWRCCDDEGTAGTAGANGLATDPESHSYTGCRGDYKDDDDDEQPEYTRAPG